MRILHILLAVLALVYVALLPGPSHALAAPPCHHAMTMTGHGADGPCEHRPTHGPCKGCSPACCAPAVIALARPDLAPAAFAHTIRAAWRATDDHRPDATGGRLLRPPTGT